MQRSNVKTRIGDRVMRCVFLVCAVTSIAAVATICVYLFAKGCPAIAQIGVFKFLFGTTWNPANGTAGPADGEYGVLPFILGTLYVTAGALLIGVTVGVFMAIFMSKFCPKFLKKMLGHVVNLLAGIPSVLFGLFGIIVIVPFFRQFDPNYLGYGLLPASTVLGIMILPTVVGLGKNALDAVPQSYYEGALAMGLTHEQAVFRVMVPAAKSGFFTAAVLGMGRAVGETMAMIMVLGNGTGIPTQLIQPIRTLTANIALEMGYASQFKVDALIANGVVLVVFTLIINVSLSLFLSRHSGGKKRKRNKEGRAYGDTGK